VNYDLIKLKVLETYRKCNLQSFPIDCLEIYEVYGLKAHPYSTLSEPLRSYCYDMSDDSLIFEHTICYNDDPSYPIGRIRFSLAHELAHHVLEHSLNRTDLEEAEANAYASLLLAPRIAIHYSNCKNCNDVANIFDLSIEAATIAFDDYRKWRRYHATHAMSSIDKLTYYHFFDTELKLFIWNKANCKACGSPAYNTVDGICHKCNHVTKQVTANETLSIIRATHPKDAVEQDLKKAERNWLYGDCY
jgi:hypothetical protein